MARTAPGETFGRGTLKSGDQRRREREHPVRCDHGHLAEMRAATTMPIDLYLESPDSLGGVVRGHEIADFVAVGAPIYTKFGLRNSRMLYPSGLHTYEDAKLIGREKVRRVAIALEWLGRLRPGSVQSAPDAQGLGIPEAPGRRSPGR